MLLCGGLLRSNQHVKNMWKKDVSKHDNYYGGTAVNIPFSVDVVGVEMTFRGKNVKNVGSYPKIGHK